MPDPKRVERAHRRLGKSAPKFGNSVKITQAKASEPVTMDSGNRQLKKVTAAKRKQCGKEG